MICKICKQEQHSLFKTTTVTITLKDGTKFSWLECDRCRSVKLRAFGALQATGEKQ